jgi:hypothetical protein
MSAENAFKSAAHVSDQATKTPPKDPKEPAQVVPPTVCVYRFIAPASVLAPPEQTRPTTNLSPLQGQAARSISKPSQNSSSSKKSASNISDQAKKVLPKISVGAPPPAQQQASARSVPRVQHAQNPSKKDSAPDFKKRTPNVSRKDPSKRKKLTPKESGAPPLPPLGAREAVLNDPGCLRNIFAFVPDSFRFVAPVSQAFRRQYLAAHHNSTRTLLLHAAATPRMAQLWLDDGCPVMPLAVMAAQFGRLDVLRCLHDGGWLLTINPERHWLIPRSDGHLICMAAATGGHLHVLEWALTNELALWLDDMSDAAAEHGHVHVLRFAQSRGYPMRAFLRVYDGPARNGHLNVVMWFRGQGYPWDAQTCAASAGGGHLHVLQWLRANDCPWNVYTCSDAAHEGHLHILQWARANGCLWEENTCSSAAHGGHLHVLQWARANGCRWNVDTCSSAAEGGQFEIMQWARANGCPWDAHTCAAAVRQGQLPMLQWVRANGCDWDEETCLYAARYGYLDILQWARANGCPWDAAACFQAARDANRMEIVQWMITTGNI